MTGEEYIDYELRKGEPSGPNDRISIKVRSTNDDGGTTGESRWTAVPHDLFHTIRVIASSTERELQSLRYALSCLVEDPGYLSSPDTQADLERLAARLSNTDTEGNA